MADGKFEVTIHGLTKDQAHEVYNAASKLGPYAIKLTEDGKFVMGGAPNVMDAPDGPNAGTAPTFSKTKD